MKGIVPVRCRELWVALGGHKHERGAEADCGSRCCKNISHDKSPELGGMGWLLEAEHCERAAKTGEGGSGREYRSQSVMHCLSPSLRGKSLVAKILLRRTGNSICALAHSLRW